MASTTPRRPEQFRDSGGSRANFGISEFAASLAGALSPYGPELEFPLPVERLRYTHPGPADRPNLADGR